MKLKKLTAIVLLLALMVPFLVSCFKEKTPSEFWNEAVEGIAQASNLSLNAKIKLGTHKFTAKYSSNRENNEKSYDVKVDDYEFQIYTDGNKNDHSRDDIRYSVDSDKDNAIIRGLLGLDFTNSDALNLTDENMMSAAYLKFEDYATLDFKISGETLTKMIAENEQITFTEAKISVKLDTDGNFKNISIITTVSGGNSFRGMPMFIPDSSAQTELIIELEEISFSNENSPKAPENKSEIDDIPVYALFFPTALASGVNKSSSMTTLSDTKFTIGTLTISSSSIAKKTVQIVDGVELSREITTTTTENLNGEISESVTDAFKNGRNRYTYYTDSRGESYKILDKEPEDDETEDEEFTAEILKKAKINENEIIITLTKEEFYKFDENGTISNDYSDFDIPDIEIKLILKDGYLYTISFGFSISTNGESSEAENEQTIGLSIESIIRYDSPLSSYTVQIPEGYENYEDLT